MGQKVHPYGLRLGIIRQAKSTWFAEGPKYRDQLLGDLRIRQFINTELANASVSNVTLERAADTVTITIETGKPGIVIGRGGRDVERLRRKLEAMTKQKVRVNVEEAKDPDTNATLVAQNIARQIERRVSYRRAMKQAIDRALRMGAKGMRCMVSGRLQGAEIARTESMGPEGRVPLHTLRADVHYGFAEAKTGYGNIGVKVWIYKGDILPPRKIKTADMYVPEEEAAEEAAPETVEEALAGPEVTADATAEATVEVAVEAAPVADVPVEAPVAEAIETPEAAPAAPAEAEAPASETDTEAQAPDEPEQDGSSE